VARRRAAAKGGVVCNYGVGGIAFESVIRHQSTVSKARQLRNARQRPARNELAFAKLPLAKKKRLCGAIYVFVRHGPPY